MTSHMSEGFKHLEQTLTTFLTKRANFQKMQILQK
jgi:hypothetical protein